MEKVILAISKIFFILLFFKITLSNASTNTSDCDESEISAALQSVAFYKSYYDVEDKLNYIKECQSSEKPRLTENEYLDYLYEGKTAEASFKLEQLKSASLFRNTSNEIAELKKYAEKSNLKYFLISNEKLIANLEQTAKTKSIEDNSHCSSVNLIDRFPLVRDQDTIGWCYAFAAADLLSFKTGKTISAIDIAVNYSHEFKLEANERNINQGEFSEKNEGGYSYDAIDSSLKKGLCLENDSPSEFLLNDKSFYNSIKYLENPFNDLYTQDNFITKVKNKCEIKSLNEYQNIKNIALNVGPQNIIYEINEGRCKDKRFKSNISSKLNDIRKRHKQTNDIRTKIFENLDINLDNSEPTIITYNPGFLQDDRDQKGLHASSIIGRRYNTETKKCEYLIRNSWGTNCKKYSDEYSSEKNCINGNIWVSRETVHQNIVGITYFEQDKK